MEFYIHDQYILLFKKYFYETDWQTFFELFYTNNLKENLLTSHIFIKLFLVSIFLEYLTHFDNIKTSCTVILC